MFKLINFHELMAMLWAACMTMIVVFIYPGYGAIWKVLLFWGALAQVLVALRVAMDRRKRRANH